MKLENIEAATAEVAKAEPKDRRRLINEYLRGVATFDTPQGKALLQRRALFVTELRQKGLWAG